MCVVKQTLARVLSAARPSVWRCRQALSGRRAHRDVLTWPGPYCVSAHFFPHYPRWVLGSFLLATLAASCGSSGDTGHIPQLLSSTTPSAPVTHAARRADKLVVICLRTGTPTTLPATVPDLIGLGLQDALRNVVCQGFRFVISPSSGSATGVVIAQTPPAGAPTPANATISVSVRKP